MALSNWDTLAFGSDGKPSNGSVVTHKGYRLSIYKNWLNVAAPEGDFPDFSNQVITSIQHGELDCGGFHIFAKRHDDQNAVFVFAKNTTYHDTNENGERQEPTIIRMCGIGCYGFLSEIEWYKINHPDLFAQLPKEIQSDNVEVWTLSSIKSTVFVADPEDESIDQAIEFEVPDDWPKPEFDELWVGVKESTFKAFIEWLDTLFSRYDTNDKKYIKTISLDNARRFNQGDSFFASAGVVEENSISTKVGETQKIAMSHLLDNMKKANAEDS